MDCRQTYSPGHHGERGKGKEGERECRRKDRQGLRKTAKLSAKKKEKEKYRDWLSGSLSDRSDKVHHGLVMRSWGKYGVELAEPERRPDRESKC